MGSSLKQLVLSRRASSIWKAVKRPQFSAPNSIKKPFLSALFSTYRNPFQSSNFGSEISFDSIPYHHYFVRRFSSSVEEESQGPTIIDYHSLLPEDEYQKLANSTIHDLLEKLEEYGNSVDIDGYDIDYGNEVLTVKLGNLGTYVINKQTPNRQIWMSSPVSGPSRFDWDQNAEAWIYRRTKASLFKILENELKQLCGQPINIS
ncbi:hypothetical protein ACH5RR_038379 [Cinchona calisaya]|uniref:ferroxidase n=1 Tax=Cinchona calisaya TaxID=153742 RepID=A0ABD2XXQ4_9GENT